MDGYVSLNDWPSVAYQVQFPNKADFDWVNSSGESQENASYSYVNSGTTFAKLETTPDMPDKGEYTFDGWYTDEGCTDTDKVNDSTPITEDTIFYGQYVKKGPDLTVTKELKEVLRDGSPLEGTLDDDTTLYGDVVTWEITVANGTGTPKSYSLSDDIEYVSSENLSFPAEGTILWSDDSSESSFNQNEFTVQAGHTKTITAQYTIEDHYGGHTLTNTATVTAKDETAEAKDSTSNPIGHILTVTYKGNGGTQANGAETVTETVRAPSLPYAYEVKTGNLGFQKEGYTFVGWYKDLTCEDPVEETEELHSGAATYFAKWTKDEEQIDPATDIFFFIALPTNKAMSGSENDYRHLTRGAVIDKALADAARIDATGITSLDNESEITRFVSEWPTAITDLPRR